MKASVDLSISVCLESDCGLRVWLPLPATREQLQNALNGIISLNEYDYFIAEYSNTVPGLSNDQLMSAGIGLVNYLAAQLEKMTEEQVNTLIAVMESGHRFTTPEQFVDFPHNGGYFSLLSHVRCVDDLARYYLYESGLVNMPEGLKKFIGLTMFGINAAESEVGAFTTKGYLSLSGKKWKDVVAKKGVPSRYRLPVTELNDKDARPDPVLRSLRRKAEHMAGASPCDDCVYGRNGMSCDPQSESGMRKEGKTPVPRAYSRICVKKITCNMETVTSAVRVMRAALFHAKIRKGAFYANCARFPAPDECHAG